MGKNILTLDSLEPDRDFIAIDGKEYYLRADGELSITQIARIRKLAKEVSEKDLSTEISEDDATKLESYIAAVLDLVVIGLPPDLRNKLRQEQKLAIITAFTAAASSRRAEAMAEKPTTGG